MFRKCLAKKGNERFSFIVLNNAVQHGYPAHSLLSFRSPERTGQHQTSEKLSAAMNHWCKLLVGAGQASPLILFARHTSLPMQILAMVA